MSFRVFEPSYDFIDERVNVFLGDRLSSVIAEVEGPLRIALVLYVVLYGVAILRGAISEPVKPGWVIGTAEFRIPWLGWIRLAVAEATTAAVVFGTTRATQSAS